MCTTFVLYVLTNYASEKRYSRWNVKKRKKWREFFASIFSGPGELLGKTAQIKSKTRRVIYNDSSLLCKNIRILAFIVTEELCRQERPLKSHLMGDNSSPEVKIQTNFCKQSYVTKRHLCWKFHENRLRNGWENRESNQDSLPQETEDLKKKQYNHYKV